MDLSSKSFEAAVLVSHRRLLLSRRAAKQRMRGRTTVAQTPMRHRPKQGRDRTTVMPRVRQVRPRPADYQTVGRVRVACAATTTR